MKYLVNFSMIVEDEKDVQGALAEAVMKLRSIAAHYVPGMGVWGCGGPNTSIDVVRIK